LLCYEREGAPPRGCSACPPRLSGPLAMVRRRMTLPELAQLEVSTTMQKHRLMQFGAAFAMIAALAIEALGATALARPASGTPQVTTKVSAGPSMTISTRQVALNKGATMLPKSGAKHDARVLPQLLPEGNKAYQSWQHSNRGAAAPKAVGGHD